MDLREWQIKERWTATAIAKEIGVSPSTITGVALKLNKPSLMLAKNIVRFTKGEVTLEDLGVEEK